MRFLSVAERELRAGARHKATHRLRWITAAVFFALLVWLMWAFSGFRAPQIFQSFSAIIFFYCLIVGTAHTADCLSAEKREGTMGLLFLTNLNGVEIIGGKLCSSALAASYGLFAIFPLLAGQMLVGGITLGHFWRTVLALIEAILFAVASGFLASSLCVRQFTAIATATGLALSFSAGLMAAGAVITALRTTKGSKVLVDSLAMFSPLYTFVSAKGLPVFRTNRYWWSVLAVTGVSLAFLAIATWQVSRTWRDRPVRTGLWGKTQVLQRWRDRGRAGRAALRRRLLGINPFYWLGGRRAISAPMFMLLTVIIVASASYVFFPFFARVIPFGVFAPMFGHMFTWFWAGLLIHALVLYYAAMIASRRLAEDKQTGALELVLSTPTSERVISRGLWMSYARRMFFPALVAILVHCFFLWQGATMAILDPPGIQPPPGTTPIQLCWHLLLNQPFGSTPLAWEFLLAARIGVLSLVLFILIWITLGWLGRWLGLRMKHPGFTPMVSLALVLVPPVVVFTFACYCVDKFNLDQLPARQFVPIMMWIAFGLQAGHCLLLSLWAAGRLRRDFRRVVTSRFQPKPLRPWWRISRRTVIRYSIRTLGAGVAVTLIILSFYGYQNWKSRRTWSTFQTQLKQHNESLDVIRLLPGPVPKGDNFALAPAFQTWAFSSGSNNPTGLLFKELKQFDTRNVHPSLLGTGLDWAEQQFAPLEDYLSLVAPKAKLSSDKRPDIAKTLLEGFKRHEQILRELGAASCLPYFQSSTNRGAPEVLHPQQNEVLALEGFHMLLQMRACALLASKQSAEAGEDLMTGLQIVRLAQQIPDARSSIRVQILLARSLQPLWEGIVDQRWTEAQLARFQTELSQFNLLMNHTNTVQRVVLATIQMWRDVAENQGTHTATPNGPRREVRQMQPRAWWLDNCIALYQARETALSKINVVHQRVYLDSPWVDLEGLPLDDTTTALLQQPHWTGASAAIVVFAQTAVNQAIIACALERYRLVHGNYPETLDELIPSYLSTIPNDVVRGRPMLYENGGDGRFTLRSVGPNQNDDRKKPTSDDWLWSFPTNAPPAVAR